MNDHSKPIKILIVDDEERLLRVLRFGLKPLGYDIRTASDGEEAFKELLSKPYDVILTDIKMPKLNGVELIYELERLNIDIPVIVITAYADVDSAVKSLKHGAFDYIQKPFTIEELEKVIHEVYHRHQVKEDSSIVSLHQGVEEKEKELIQKALLKSKDVKSKAAKLLNISERTLWYKVKRYKLK